MDMPREPNMKQTSFFVRPDQLEKLQRLSDNTLAPVAALVRQAIDIYLEQRKKDWQK
jgi:predicted DNA-binding protein